MISDRLKHACLILVGVALVIVAGMSAVTAIGAQQRSDAMTANVQGRTSSSRKELHPKNQPNRLAFIPSESRTPLSPSSGKSTASSSSSTTKIKASFRIMQLTDLHLGDRERGPEKDRKTFALMKRIIPLENPDFIVMSGDQLTSKNVDKNATAYYNLLGDFLDSYQIPYAMIFGNHDEAPFEPSRSLNVTTTVRAKTTRQQLVQTDQQHAYSLTQQGPEDVYGVSNYVLPVWWNGELTMQMFFFDTGGGSSSAWIEQSQLDWFRANRKAKLDAIVFQHIPVEQQVFRSDSCSGFTGEPGIDSIKRDAGVLRTFQEDGSVRFMAVGHNHHQSYCCSSGSNSTFHMCFGRHSGYGGYGNWDRGAKIYEMQIEQSNADKLSWRSWTRLESGDVVDLYDPAD